MKYMVIASLVVVGIVIVWYFFTAYQLDVSGYRGDGAIEPTGYGIIARGYTIDIPINISKTVSKIKLSGLPQSGKDIHFSFALPDLKDANLDIYVTIFDSNGLQENKIMLNTGKALVGYNDKYEKTYLSPECTIKNNDSIIEISTDSAAVHRAHLIVKSGGHK
jgi:hypothetical protein